MVRASRCGAERPCARHEPKPNEGKPGKPSPAIFAFLCPRPPLRSFTKEMGVFEIQMQGSPSGRLRSPKGFDRFLRSQLRRIGLGHPLRARPRNGRAWSAASDAVLEPELQPRSPLRMQRPRSPQARQRGASPRRILLSLGGLSTAVAEPTPPRRSWMSLLGARPLADRLQSTTRRKSLACSVTFLRDPTTPISVTWLNDLTGRLPTPATNTAPRELPSWSAALRIRPKRRAPMCLPLLENWTPAVPWFTPTNWSGRQRRFPRQARICIPARPRTTSRSSVRRLPLHSTETPISRSGDRFRPVAERMPDHARGDSEQ
jgi:hypothetical protein